MMMMLPQQPPLSPVPEDSICITRMPTRSEPSLLLLPPPPPSRSPRHLYVHHHGGPRVPRRPPPPPRSVSFPPASAMRASADLMYDGNGSKESIIASEYLRQVGGDFYGPRIVRGLDLEHGSGGADTVTVASSMSEEIETRRTSPSPSPPPPPDNSLLGRDRSAHRSPIAQHSIAGPGSSQYTSRSCSPSSHCRRRWASSSADVDPSTTQLLSAFFFLSFLSSLHPMRSGSGFWRH